MIIDEISSTTRGDSLVTPVDRDRPTDRTQAVFTTDQLFCSLDVLDPRVGWPVATPWTYFLHLSLSCVILIDCSTESPVVTVHVLMLSIPAVRGLPRFRAPGMFLALSLSPGNSLVSS